MTQGEIDGWRTYVGRKEVRRQSLDLETLRRFAVAVGSSVDVERQAPPLAHWAYFLDTLPMTKFSFRATAPLFVNQTVKLSPGVEPSQFQAIRCDGTVAMSAETGADRSR
jgi:hydroxyacyl-ACP dehydratase HTD2-like protein with hotdog domain